MYMHVCMQNVQGVGSLFQIMFFCPSWLCGIEEIIFLNSYNGIFQFGKLFIVTIISAITSTEPGI